MGFLILTVILFIGMVSRNSVMVYSAALLVCAEFLGARTVISLLGTYGIPVGVTFLIMVVLLPLGEGEIRPQELANFLASPEGLAAAAVGALTTYLGGEGVELMQANPQVVVGIVVGTTLGTVFFRGIPTGPLVAAGAVAVALRFLL